MNSFCNRKSRILRTICHVLICLGLVLMVASSAYGRNDHRGRWWQTPKMQQALSLTGAEINKLDAAYDEVRYRMIEIRSDVRAERLKLRQLMTATRFDETAIRAQYRKYQLTRNRLRDERFAFLLETRNILGHDRFIKLLQIRDESRRRHRSHRWDATKKERTDRTNKETGNTE